MNFYTYTPNQHGIETRAPRKLSTPPVQPSNLCPFCRKPGYHSPGPCRHCGTFGYAQEISPFMAGRKTYRRVQGDPLVDSAEGEIGECSEEDLLDSEECSEEVQDFLQISSMETVDPLE